VPHASCSNCETEIADHTSMVERQGRTFCCSNCAVLFDGAVGQTSIESCAHCHNPIVDPSTHETAGQNTYCCGNCATAAAASAASP
jgi:hypothetical protein